MPHSCSKFSLGVCVCVYLCEAAIKCQTSKANLPAKSCSCTLHLSLFLPLSLPFSLPCSLLLSLLIFCSAFFLFPYSYHPLSHTLTLYPFSVFQRIHFLSPSYCLSLLHILTRAANDMFFKQSMRSNTLLKHIDTIDCFPLFLFLCTFFDHRMVLINSI